MSSMFDLPKRGVNSAFRTHLTALCINACTQSSRGSLTCLKRLLRLTKVQVAGCGLRATDCGLRVCGLRATDCGLRATNCGLQVCGLRATDWGLWAAGHRLQAEGMRAAGHRLPAMGHRLQLRAKCGVRVKYFDPSLCD